MIMNNKLSSFVRFSILLVTLLLLLVSTAESLPRDDFRCLQTALRMSTLVHRHLNESRYYGVAVEDCRRLFEINGQLLRSVAVNIRSSSGADVAHQTRTRLSAVLTNYHTCRDGLVEAGSPFLGGNGNETEAVMSRAGKAYSVALGLVTQSLSQNASQHHSNNNRRNPAPPPPPTRGRRRHHNHHHLQSRDHHASPPPAEPSRSNPGGSQRPTPPPPPPPQRQRGSTGGSHHPTQPPPPPPAAPARPSPPRESHSPTPPPPQQQRGSAGGSHHPNDHQSRTDIIKGLRETMSCSSSEASCPKRHLMLPGLQGDGILINKAVIVSRHGGEDFTTIGDAIKAAPDNLTPQDGHYLIYAIKGVYEEYFSISTHKKNILLVGDGIGATIVTGNHSNAGGWGTSNSATAAMAGERFIAIDMTFRNTYGPGTQAVAVRNQADKSAFYRCSFEGYQDTLLVHSMNQFYRECTVIGSVDFIFGDAEAIFQNSLIVGRKGMSATVAAQGRTEPEANTGIAFHNCTVDGESELDTDFAGSHRRNSYLGRPWKRYARTVYVQCYIGEFINPKGWRSWNGSQEGLNTLYYGEYRNRGPGAATGERVTWPGYQKSMSTDEALRFSVHSFIDGDSWLPATAIPFYSGLLD